MATHKSYAVIDFETTGFGATDRVIEIGVVLLDHQLKVERTWETLVQPGRDISNSFVHHITASDVVDAPSFENVAGELAALLDGRTVVAHNAPFEVRFLRREFGRLGLIWPNYGAWIVDTMRMVKQNFPGESSTLTHALELVGITNTRPHSALADAMATAELFEKLSHDGAELTMSSATLTLPVFDYPAPARLLARGGANEAESDSRNQWLAKLSATLPEGGSGGVDNYKRLLKAALADKELSRTEIHQLENQAKSDGLSHDDLVSVHEEFIRQLAIEAWLDGVITDDERRTLTTLNQQLGLPEGYVEELLSNPVEGECELGLELKPGDHVALTGQMDLPRSEWAKRAESAGLVVGNVTKKCVLLVAADPDSMSGKARKARERGVPVVGEKTFAQLLRAMSMDEADEAETLTAELTPEVQPLELEIFPWLATLLGDKHVHREPGEIAAMWIEHHSNASLVELSPRLTTTTTIEVRNSFRSGYNQWFALYREPLTATVEDLGDLSSVGAHKLRMMVEAVVLAAMDEEHEPQDAQGFGEFYAGDEHHETVEEFVGTTDDNAVNWSDMLLFAGWHQLCTTGAASEELPAEISGRMPELSKRLRGVDPVEKLFTSAAETVIAAAEGDKRRLDIIKERWIGGATLDDLGQRYGVTRERIRQLEALTRKKFDAERAFFDTVVAKVEERVRPLAKVDDVRSHLPALKASVDLFDCSYSELFVALGGKWSVVDGWAMVPNFVADLEKALAKNSDGYGNAKLSAVAASVGISAELLEEFLVRGDFVNMLVVDGTVLTKVRSHQDRAVSVLALKGEPMTAEEIFEILGGGNVRSASNQYAIDPRLVKVSQTQWALKEWGGEEFASIASWIGEKIDAGNESVMVDDPITGGTREVHAVSLQSLFDESERLQVSENSIRAHASMGDYQIVDGWVIHRVDESDNKIETDVEDARDLYLRDGEWNLLLTVTKDHLRGSGFQIPLPIAGYYDMSVNSVQALDSPLGDQFVRVNGLKQASTSTIRRFLMQLGAKAGERVWLKFGADKTFDVAKANGATEGLEGKAWLYDFMGLDAELLEFDGSMEESLARVNEALGLDADAPRRRTVAMFRHRKQDDVADLIRELG